ncbi:nuclear transport factor 2 family protein [Solimonas sp. K1W22B-7]|uniref:nuclear transport factor 2 family protein n=1 Tax=Solimonas sp. K1W22B-7 TaxID=2303331 RepID=UPI000E32F906|nr:nuclear transport factor 2 family protein [Solimonas sp. K1W22B-7]AXQ27333.1 nuclear transport factor 2 family protein [Solimonas sp. K1W22B-7]
MLTQTEAEAFAAEWIAAWNSHDLARILSHYAPDFEFSSPFIAQIAGEPSGKLRGHEAVGAYWGKALTRFPELRFDLESVLWGVDSLVIHYRRFDGRRAMEWFEFGTGGKVRRSAAHYAD